MKANDIKLNDKGLALLRDTSRFILVSGPTGTGKTFLTGIKTFLRVFNAPPNETQFAIVAESQTTAEKMFVDDKSSFYQIFGDVCDFKGGRKPHIEVRSPTGIKQIYLGGYGTKRDYEKILGLNLSGLHIEEVTIAHDDFIRESFVRALRLGSGWVHGTTNGGIPEQIVYTEFWNKSFYDKRYNTNMPIQEVEALKESDKNFKFWYWGFDDSTTLTEKNIKDLYNSFPVGSFYYNSKILGIRGYVEGMLYARLLNDTYINKDNARANNVRIRDMNILSIRELIIGVDIGSGTGKDQAARTVFTIVGYTRNYQRAVVIDSDIAKGEVDYNDIVRQFWAFANPYWSIWRHTITEIRVDSADALFIRTLRNNNPYNIMVAGSIKDTIPLRVQLKQQLLHQHRLLFSDTKGSQMLKYELAKIKSDGKDGHIDDNTLAIDMSDSLDYALTPRKHQLMSAKW